MHYCKWESVGSFFEIDPFRDHSYGLSGETKSETAVPCMDEGSRLLHFQPCSVNTPQRAGCLSPCNIESAMGDPVFGIATDLCGLLGSESANGSSHSLFLPPSLSSPLYDSAFPTDKYIWKNHKWLIKCESFEWFVERLICSVRYKRRKKINMTTKLWGTAWSMTELSGSWSRSKWICYYRIWIEKHLQIFHQWDW